MCLCVYVERLGCVLRDGGTERRRVCVVRDGEMSGYVCGGRATVWVAVSREQRGLCVSVCVCVCGCGETGV